MQPECTIDDAAFARMLASAPHWVDEGPYELDAPHGSDFFVVDRPRNSREEDSLRDWVSRKTAGCARYQLVFLGGSQDCVVLHVAKRGP